MKKKKRLLAYVFRWNLGDCTASGISEKHDKLIIVGEGIDEVFEVDENTPAVELVKAEQGGKCLHVKPLDETRWTMFGGNFIYSSDSRFASLNNGNPIKIFDRIEN